MRYLRKLEDLLIDLLEEFGIPGSKIEGKTGVWVQDRKIASIGVGVRKWVTMHGFALNVASDLSGFLSIIPCGISGVQMTSISKESGGDSLETVREDPPYCAVHGPCERSYSSSTHRLPLLVRKSFERSRADFADPTAAERECCLTRS